MTEHVSGGPAASAFIDQAKNYRAQGGGRPELVDYLQRCGVDAAGAEVIADRFDLELGLAGVSRPGDISPTVAAQLDQRTASISAPVNTASTIEAEIHAAVEQTPLAVADTPRDVALAPAPAHPTPAATPVSITTIEITPPAPLAPAPETGPAQVDAQTEAAMVAPITEPAPTAVDASPPPMTLAEYLGSPTPDTPAALATPAAPVQPAVQPASPPPAPTDAATATAEQGQSWAEAPPVAETAPPAPTAPTPGVPTPSPAAAPAPTPPAAPTPTLAAPAPSSPATPNPTSPGAPSSVAAVSASNTTTARAPRPDSTEADATPWQETTDFGYKIAQSWDDGDPNEAINSANELARAGKSQEEIVEYLLECNVSPGEAEYVASMTGARRTKRPESAVTEAKPRGGARRVALAIAMVVAGLAVMYLGWSAYQSGTDTGRRSPLGIVAVGGALVLNALRTLIRR